MPLPDGVTTDKYHDTAVVDVCYAINQALEDAGQEVSDASRAALAQLVALGEHAAALTQFGISHKICQYLAHRIHRAREQHSVTLHDIVHWHRTVPKPWPARGRPRSKVRPF